MMVMLFYVLMGLLLPRAATAAAPSIIHVVMDDIGTPHTPRRHRAAAVASHHAAQYRPTY